MGADPQRVVRFPTELVARAATGDAQRWQVWRGRLREQAGRMLSGLGVPGALADTEIKDALTGQEISVAVGAHFVRLSVDGRDYYFDRITGRFDGTGAAP